MHDDVATIIVPVVCSRTAFVVVVVDVAVVVPAPYVCADHEAVHRG